MNNQASTEPQSNGEESWVERELPYIGDAPLLGFLQLCADRRFHTLIQREFQADAGLREPTDYWIHADAGGTPKMENLTIAPDYCYKQKGVRLMGWSAHGAGCGGFGEHVPDHVIRKALQATFKIQQDRYWDARHFCYFVTIKKEPDKEEKVVCYKLSEK